MNLLIIAVPGLVYSYVAYSSLRAPSHLRTDRLASAILSVVTINALTFYSFVATELALLPLRGNRESFLKIIVAISVLQAMLAILGGMTRYWPFLISCFTILGATVYVYLIVHAL